MREIEKESERERARMHEKESEREREIQGGTITSVLGGVDGAVEVHHTPLSTSRLFQNSRVKVESVLVIRDESY